MELSLLLFFSSSFRLSDETLNGIYPTHSLTRAQAHSLAHTNSHLTNRCRRIKELEPVAIELPKAVISNRFLSRNDDEKDRNPKRGKNTMLFCAIPPSTFTISVLLEKVVFSVFSIGKFTKIHDL